MRTIMVPDLLKRLPEVQALLPDFGVDSALSFVGKKSDKMSQKMIVDGTEPGHTTFWGSKLADRLAELNQNLRKFPASNRGPFTNDEQRDAVQRARVKLSLDLKRHSLAHKIARAVAMHGSLELPHPDVDVKEGDPSMGRVAYLDKRVKVKRGDVVTEKAIFDLDEADKLYWIDAMLDQVLEHIRLTKSDMVLAGA